MLEMSDGQQTPTHTISKSRGTQESEPKYFINAACPFDEEFTPALASSPLSASWETQKLNNVNRQLSALSGQAQGLHQLQQSQEDKLLLEKTSHDGQQQSVSVSVSSEPGPKISRDVANPPFPTSKSYPDIIQTTLGEEMMMMRENEKARGDPDPETQNIIMSPVEPKSLAADSLEELTISINEGEALDYDGAHSAPRPPRPQEPFLAFESMSESTIGISGENPPESWVIDFNSMSLENQGQQGDGSSNHNKAGQRSSSNSNSLSFFIDMDKLEGSAPEPPGKDDPRKPIFSMFVDIGGKGSGSAQEQSQSTTMSSSITGRSSSGATSSRVSSISKVPRYEGCMARSSQGQGQGSTEGFSRGGGHNGGGGGIDPQGDEGAFSNRSSLHIPNESDGSMITSSIMSSMETSVPEEMELCQGGPCFKLGMDLLRMFQDSINTDVNIKCGVNGRFVKAHKCILASRSQYFAAILSGNWVERAGNTITLDGFSYNVVQFTMYHIYSGTNEIPDTIDLIELASLTDLLGLEGLREVISQTIRTRFCHNFHRPCTGCVSGVLECFPIAINYGMDDLHRKMTKWICKHFVRIWPTKAFANLGDDLIEKCLRYSVNHLSPENLLDITLGTDQLNTTMPTLRWTECVFTIVGQLSEACVQYVGENLTAVLKSQRFLQFGKGQTWNIPRIEPTFLEGILLLKPDEACTGHIALSSLIELGTRDLDEVEYPRSFIEFLRKLRTEIEKYLISNASKAVLSKYWESLSPEVRKRICTSSFLGYDKAGNKIGKVGASGTSGVTPTNNPNSSRPTSAQQSNNLRNKKLETCASSGSTRPGSASTTTATRVSSAAAVAGRKDGSIMTSKTQQPNKAPTNVASVRPVQQQTPGSGTSSSSSTGRAAQVSYTSTRQASNPLIERSRATPRPGTTQTSRRPTREKSFENVGWNSSQGKPLTPVTPSTRSILSEFQSASSSSSNNRRPSNQPRSRPHPPPPIPQESPKRTKPAFLTNSEKAKAVSKPILRPKKVTSTSRSNSITSTETELIPSGDHSLVHSRQGSLGSGGTAGAPRTPNLSQPSRYATSSSNSKRLNSANGPQQKVQAQAPPRSPIRSVSSSTRINSSKTTRSNNPGPSVTKTTWEKAQLLDKTPPPRPSRTTTGRSRNNNTTTNHHSGSGQRPKTPSSTTESQMSRSSFEPEGDEPKMRTLAEIGRSSTFSKDEPTILGRMDFSLEIDNDSM